MMKKFLLIAATTLAIATLSGCASLPKQSYNRVGDNHDYPSKCMDPYYSVTHDCIAFQNGE